MTRQKAALAGRRLALAAAAAFAAAAATGTGRVQAQGPGTEGLSCIDQAWRDLNNCYMSGEGYWHDVACEAAFYVDVAGCAAGAYKDIKVT